MVMGGKKRGVSSIDEEEEVVVEAKNVDENRKKKGKNKEQQTDAPSTTTKPMERKKKRKLLDKVRHSSDSAACETKGTKLTQDLPLSKPEEDTSRNGEAVFHISIFSVLASANAFKRELAAEKLAVELQEVQKAYEDAGCKDVVEGGVQLEAAKDDGLDNCAPSVRYAVRRLIRGVSSSRECARQGFALGLTILVSTNSRISVDSLLKLIVDSLEVTSSMKGQEARDSFLGRLFAYGALVRSGRLKEEWESDRNNPCVKDFSTRLISLASEKRYLQEPAVSVLLSLVEMLPEEVVINHILDAPGLREWFEKATSDGNPDALLLALETQQKIATNSTVFGNLLPRPFSPSRFFTVHHLTTVANCLKDSTFCQPRVHGIWPLLVSLLLPDKVVQDASSSSSLSSTKKNKKSRRSSSSDEDTAESLRCFCEVILEGSLLASSHVRKHLAFDVLLLMLPRLPACHLPIVLSRKFVQGLMDILSTKDSWLYKVAEHFLKELLVWVGTDDIRRVFVVVALQKHSGGRFDCITRTKTIKDLMVGFTTESGCMLFLQKLTSMFVDEDHESDEPSDQSQTTDENSEIGLADDKESADRSINSDLLKSWIVESLPSLLKYLALDIEAKFRVQKEVMKFLAVQGLFSASLGTEVTSFELQEKFEWPKTPISNALCKMCIDQLQLLLSNAQKAEGPHALINSLETNDLGYYFMHFLGTLCTIPSVSLVRPLNNEDEKAFKKLQALESRLSREERNCGLSADANKLHALRYLLIQLLLQLLLRPGEYTEATSELIICCRKAFSIHDLAESSGEDEPEDGSPELMDVLVDTLLSLLPQSSAPLRSAVEQVFRYFCNDVTDDGLLRMLRVIKKDLKPARHKDAESEDGNDDDDDDLLDIEEAEESDEADTVQASETSVVSDDSEAAFKVGASDNDSSDADDDSDEGMDDEAMFRMDSYLAKIFQDRKSQAGGDTAHAQLVLFKLRVLSLIEIYLHENPGSSKVLTVYSNLVQAFVNPSTTEGSEQLAERIWGILQKKIFKAKEYPKSEGVELSMLEALLEKSLRLASRPFRKKRSSGSLPQKKQSLSWKRYKMINSLAQQSTYWLLKVIEGKKIPESQLNQVFEIFKGTLTNYFETKKSQLKPEFLKEVFKRRPWVGQHLFGFLVEKCGDAKSDYRRVESLELVSELLKSILAENTAEASKTFLKAHLTKISKLIKQLASQMPEKQSRRADARKFCTKVFQSISTHNLAKSFVKTLEPDDHTACESQFGESFLALKTKVK